MNFADDKPGKSLSEDGSVRQLHEVQFKKDSVVRVEIRTEGEDGLQQVRRLDGQACIVFMLGLPGQGGHHLVPAGSQAQLVYSLDRIMDAFSKTGLLKEAANYAMLRNLVGTDLLGMKLMGLEPNDATEEGGAP